jgi:hypothetical protein
MLRKVLWWQKDHVPLTPEATFIASSVARNNILFQSLFKTVVITSDLQTTLLEMESTNCQLPSRLTSLLDQWKQSLQRCEASAGWAQFYIELGRNGLPQSNKDDFIHGVKENILAAVSQANTMEGYHFIRAGGEGRGGGFGSGGGGRYIPPPGRGGRGGGGGRGRGMHAERW